MYSLKYKTTTSIVLVLLVLTHDTDSQSFPFRCWCETGALLDLPDVAYYSTVAPDYLNNTRLNQEVASLRMLPPILQQMNMTAFMVSNWFGTSSLSCRQLFTPAIDDYVTYQGISPSLYPPGSVHYNRSVALSARVDNLLKSFKVVRSLKRLSLICIHSRTTV